MRLLGVLFCLIGFVTFAASSALALEINVGPDTLVLSSGVQHVTVHSDFPYRLVEDEGVTIKVNGTTVPIASKWANSIGNLMVRCTKAEVAKAVGSFDGASTKATVTLIVNTTEEASNTIVVKK